MKRFVCLFGVVVALAGTGVSISRDLQIHDEPPASQASGYLRFETRKFHREYGECGGKACVEFTIEYPEIIGAHVTEAATINQTIRQWVLEQFGDRQVPKDLEGVAQEFIKSYKEARADASKFKPEYSRPWYRDETVKVEYESVSVLSLSLLEEVDSGGMHPVEDLKYASFRPSTGERIHLQDFLKQGYMERLNTIAEGRFRALKGLSPTESLNGALFWFKNDRFQLNDNFMLGPNGLAFYFNQYEIACYACGTTKLFLPYCDLRDLIRPDAQIP